MKEEFHHVIIRRLTVSAVRLGIINPEGLDDDEIQELLQECDMMENIIYGIHAIAKERQARRHVIAKGNVIEISKYRRMRDDY